MLSKEEIEKAKEQLRSLQENAKVNIDTDEIFKMDYEAIEIIFKYIDELEIKAKMQNKTIDEMAKHIAQVSDCPREMFEIDLDCEKRCGGKDTDIKCWKIYFKKKVGEK